MIKNILFASAYLLVLISIVRMHKPPSHAEQDRGWTKATRGGGVSILTYAERQVSEEEVRNDVVKMLRRHGKVWSQDTIDTVTKVLQFGNNHKDYRVDYKIVLGFFGHESKMCVIPACSIGYNTDGTVDYGLGQHNSDYIRNRWVKARWLAQKYDIIPGRLPGSDYFDVMAQSISTIEFLRENRQWLDNYGRNNNISYGLKDWILVYNLGQNGYLSNRKGEAFNQKYTTLVLSGFHYLNNNDRYSSYVAGDL